MRSEQEALDELLEILEELGWSIAVADSESGTVSGAIIGTQEFITEVGDAYYGPGYISFERDAEGELEQAPPKKKSTLH